MYQAHNKEGEDYETKLLEFYFMLAKLFLHELAHAADEACNGPRDHKSGLPLHPPIEKNVIAEAGYDCEHPVFGGITYEPTHSQYLQFEEWPGPVRAFWYQANDGSIWIGGKLDELVTRRWRVSDA